MKKFLLDFLHRGLVACGLGPLVLAILYGIMGQTAGLEVLSLNKVCIGILSLTALAFIAGGMNAIYQIEQLPLMVAIWIHGSVLYVSYLLTYLVNDWLEAGIIPFLMFSLIFIVGFIIIWAIIYAINKRNTDSLNEKLKQRRQNLPD